MLISCAVTAQLICAFVFAYAKVMFYQDAAHVISNRTRIDVYETLCPQQMLVHKGGKIKNWDGECRDVTPTKSLSQKIRVDVNREVKFFVKIKKKILKNIIFFLGGGGGGQIGGGGGRGKEGGDVQGGGVVTGLM